MHKKILALATMEKLLKKAGAERVSEDAKEALQGVLEEKAQEICERAITFAGHSGRKTVKREDIQLVMKNR